jgi:hypothetical protein
MIYRLRRTLVNNIKNIPGWRTNRRIVVMECDDWGGIRMPSAEARDAMIKKGLNISDSRFDKYDTLADAEDLERLFTVLESVRDSAGNHAVMTPLVVVANPDFDRIRESEFLEYHYEPFRTTLQRYYPDQDVFRLWQEGLSRGVFIPELHGRDHIAVPFWMKELQAGTRELRTAFDHGYVSLETPGVPEPVSGFRAEFFFENNDQKKLLENAIEDSVKIFTDIFGRCPSTFVPGNGFFHPDFDQFLVKTGVSFLNVMHRTPYLGVKGELRYKRYVSGQKGKGITYYTRNCAFEPTENGYTGIDSTLSQIAAAFRWGKPAIISTHRVNFVGAIDRRNRERGLQELKKLLGLILKKWPDTEFKSSGSALDYLANK